MVARLAFEGGEQITGPEKSPLELLYLEHHRVDTWLGSGLPEASKHMLILRCPKKLEVLVDF